MRQRDIVLGFGGALAFSEQRAQAAAHFARHGWVQLDGFLDEGAASQLEAHLRSREDWNQHLNQGEKVFELDRATRAGLSDERRAALTIEASVLGHTLGSWRLRKCMFLPAVFGT